MCALSTGLSVSNFHDQRNQILSGRQNRSAFMISICYLMACDVTLGSATLYLHIFKEPQDVIHPYYQEIQYIIFIYINIIY